MWKSFVGSQITTTALCVQIKTSSHSLCLYLSLFYCCMTEHSCRLVDIRKGLFLLAGLGFCAVVTLFCFLAVSCCIFVVITVHFLFFQFQFWINKIFDKKKKPDLKYTVSEPFSGSSIFLKSGLSISLSSSFLMSWFSLLLVRNPRKWKSFNLTLTSYTETIIFNKKITVVSIKRYIEWHI